MRSPHGETTRRVATSFGKLYMLDLNPRSYKGGRDPRQGANARRPLQKARADSIFIGRASSSFGKSVSIRQSHFSKTVATWRDKESRFYKRHPVIKRRGAPRRLRGFAGALL